MTAQNSLSAENTASSIKLLDRDVSILAFNERVLDWAKRPEVPLLERLRYLCIVSSNLDEFFEVRADLHMTAFRNADTKGTYNIKTFENIFETYIVDITKNPCLCLCVFLSFSASLSLSFSVRQIVKKT